MAASHAITNPATLNLAGHYRKRCSEHIRITILSCKRSAPYREPKKVAAAIAGMIYFHGRVEGDKQLAERRADEALSSYEQLVVFLHSELDPVISSMYGVPMQEMSGAYLSDPVAQLPGLLEAEKKERAQFAELFYEGGNRYSDSTIG